MNNRQGYDFSLQEKDLLLIQAEKFLSFYNQSQTAAHCASVSNQAKHLANRFNTNPIQAEVAGYLHDISAIIPTPQRVMYAKSHGIPVLPEELKAPMILHQKISTVICQEVFGIEDQEILSAVGCHTTLKKEASLLDKVVFLADKIAWDQTGQPPYQQKLLTALDRSLDAAVWVYLDYLWSQHENLVVIHPWFVDAYQEYIQYISTEKQP
ncbi:MAG: HAD family hydrolase [Anaerolineaceae bacterium]|nr:HAD family hydrolase [Anaerolineaceae bacterium]